MIGQYVLDRLIGKGAMGAVYEARHEILGRRVALKVLLSSHCLNTESVARFHREALVCARLSHDNIVRLYEAGNEGDVHYLATEFVEGETLKNLAGTPRINVPDKVRMFLGLARGLQHAHGQGILHRDIKPTNVLVDSSGRALLADFGLAKLIGSDSLTREGTLVGTVYYMSPEQASADASAVVDERSDVFSLGVTFYEFLCGKIPYEFETRPSLMGALFKIMGGQIVPLEERDPGAPEALARIVARATALEPARRHQNAAQFADDLERFLDGDGTSEAPTDRFQAPRPREGLARRLRAYAGIGLAGAFVLACWYLQLRLEASVNLQTAALLNRSRLRLKALQARAAEHVSTGTALMASKQLARAREEFDAAVRLDPSSRLAGYCSALCSFRLGETGRAVKTLDEFLARHPGHADALRLRRQLLRAPGKG